MDSSPHRRAGSRDPASRSPSAPSSTKQGTKRKIRGRLSDVGATLNKGSGMFDFGPWKLALDDMGKLRDAIQRVASSREDSQAITEELDELLNDVSKRLGGTTSPAVKSSIADFAKGLRREIKFLLNKRQGIKVGRLEGAMKTDDEVKECYRRVKMLLSRLGMNASVSVWNTVDEEATDRLLKTLPDAPSAKYCSTEADNLRRGECTPNTRVELLGRLRAWACDDDAPKIYWLNGMAGTGKTTIAYSLCEYLQSIQKLGASFFCSQRLPECRDVNKIIPCISYRLSLFSVPFRDALVGVLKDDRDAYNQPLRKQFDMLFVKPLRTAINTFPANVVVVIDALDECDDQDGVTKILTTLLSYATELPVKFFVTSRPEPKIVDLMRKQEAEGVRLELRLHELESTVVRQDIATYLTVKLAPAGLSDAELKILVERSGVLFIYAATVARFIEFDNFSCSKQRLKLVVHTSAVMTNESDAGLDELYTAILKTALEEEGMTALEKETRATLLGYVVCARELIGLDVLASLLQSDDTAGVSAALRPLQSVLSVSELGVIGTLHESFPNYLLNLGRSGRFYCDPCLHHARMARRCFDLIKVPNPPFNICKLESSYVFDEDVPEIDQRANKAISDALLYACRYWAAHLEPSVQSRNLFDPLYEFLSERLLLWMEVMSLKKLLWEGVDTLLEVQTWCNGHACSNDLRLLVQDARRFVLVVSSSPLSRSTPHIYISALAFWPKSRPVTKHYRSKFSGLVDIAETAIAKHERTPIILNISVHEHISWLAYSPNGKHIAVVDGIGDVSIWDIRTGRCKTSVGTTQTDPRAIAFSHDGLCVVLGYDDGLIRIWDLQTCEMIGDPLSHSTDRILLLACSPTGDHIAAGSSDNVVRVWDTRTSQAVVSLSGHTDMICSFAYSPDGAYIASSSEDETICIWDAYSGQLLGQEPSRAPVLSVVFSPDGAYLASGSKYTTICLWDARTGEMVGEPLLGHTDGVNSVQYSPSGMRLVSGSDDGTVRLWDTHSGEIITQLLDSRGESFNWVSYSPDGAHILACSREGTAYIWDSSIVEMAVQPPEDCPTSIGEVLHTADSATVNLSVAEDAKGLQRVAKSLEGHTKPVRSIAYSPNFAYIVSGSEDCTLRIWDVHTGVMVGQPLRGHNDVILSASFSPDSTRIVSGSSDNTVCVWDVRTCAIIGAPLIGHTDWVRSISYSPDGTCIASGSDDKTIRIWDAYTGEMIGSPLLGHTREVKSVSYSPDGAFLVSGSNDKTIRIWDTRMSRMVEHPLQGHTSGIDSVAYSPDGLYIVSRSWDTLCVWDASTGSMIGQPLVTPDHNQLRLISFFSASVKLALSYLNRAIHIPRSYANQDSIQPFRLDYGNTGSMIECVFSPDATRVASGYNDGTIRVSSIHVYQILDAEMKSHGDRPYAVEPCTCSTCASHLDWGTWKLGGDGWVVMGNSQKLLWVQPGLHASLQLPHNTTVMSEQGIFQLDFRSAKLGKSWSQCYNA